MNGWHRPQHFGNRYQEYNMTGALVNYPNYHNHVNKEYEKPNQLSNQNGKPLNKSNSMVFEEKKEQLEQLKQLEEEQRKKDNQIKVRMICTVCQIRQAQLRCNQCPSLEYFCDICFAIIHQSDPIKSHKPGQIEEEKGNQNEKVNLCNKKLEEEINFCKIHKGKKFDLFCDKCNSQICSECLKSSHIGHAVLKIKDKLNEVKSRIENEMKKCEGKKKTITLLKKRIQDKKNEISTLLAILRQDTSDLIDSFKKALDKKKEDLLDKAKESNEPNFQNLINLEKQLDKVDSKLNEHISTLWNCQNGKDIISSYSFILKDKSSKISQIIGNLKSFENKFTIFDKTKIVKPSLNSSNLLNCISKLTFYNDLNYSTEDRNLNIPDPFIQKLSNPHYEYNNFIPNDHLPLNNTIYLLSLCNFLHQKINLKSPRINRQNSVAQNQKLNKTFYCENPTWEHTNYKNAYYPKRIPNYAEHFRNLDLQKENLITLRVPNPFRNPPIPQSKIND